MSINGFSDFNKDYFDQSFKKNINHWEYDKIQFRILKHVREWSAIKDSTYKYACEIGCAAGVFTKYLKFGLRNDAILIKAKESP